MPHIVERAPTGRSRCRACGQALGKGELRFGERVANPYGEGDSETTYWYHVPCAALARPEAFLEVLPAASELIDARDDLEREARMAVAHERLPRGRGAERAPTGRAACRSCRAPIAKDSWRIALAYFEEGRFVPGGFIHARCAREYFGTAGVLWRVQHFSPQLDAADLPQLMSELNSPGGP
jgi:hypothetical protein